MAQREVFVVYPLIRVKVFCASFIPNYANELMAQTPLMLLMHAGHDTLGFYILREQLFANMQLRKGRIDDEKDSDYKSKRGKW